MKNLIFNVILCSLLVGLMLINICMSYPNRYTFNTDSFLCEGVKPHADGSIADWCGNGTDFFFDITYVAAT